MGERRTDRRTVRVFRNGRNQAVRIPQEMGFGTGELFVERRGEELILSARPRDWAGLLESEAMASAEFLLGRAWWRS